MALSPARLNPPCKVHFAGWESDTFSLGRAGWDISIEEFTNPYIGVGALRMLLRYKPTKIIAQAICNEYDPIRFRQDHRFLPEFVVQRLASDFIVRTNDSFSGFQHWANTEPSIMMVDEQSLYRLPLFTRKEEPAAEELIVEPATVSELLDQIRQRQAPMQAEIRQRDRRRDAPLVHATILTFPKAA